MKEEIFPFNMGYLLHIGSLVPPILQLQKRQEKAIAWKQTFVTTYTHIILQVPRETYKLRAN